MQPATAWIRRISVLVLALLAALTVMRATVRLVIGDAMGQLLVTEQILTRGTINLDAYGPAYAATNWFVYPLNGHLYYYMPIGSSIASIPAVAAFRLAGMDVRPNEAMMQVVIAAILAGLTVWLLYILARQFLPFLPSLALSAVFWFGTSLASTGGTAMWSHDFAVPFALVALIAMVKTTEKGQQGYWPLLGLALFMAYLTRPTMALLVVFALGYTFLRSRAAAFRALAVFAALFALFVAFSLTTFGSVLPPYYLPERLASETFWTALAGNLVSPARGLLVFTPFLILIPLFALLDLGRLRSRAGLLVVALGWPIAHWIAVSRFPVWYGGYGFGPRLMMDILPGLFLAAVLVWPPDFRTWPARVLLTASLILAGFSVYVHTYQGLFNNYTNLWNAEVNWDVHPQVWFDWRYPQFLHDEARHQARVTEPEYRAAVPPPG